MNRRAALAAALLALAAGAGAWLYSTRKPADVAAPVVETSPKAEKASEPAAEAPSTVAPARPPLAAGRFDLAADGSPIAPLPESAPARVKLGVALFAYEGAQGVPSGFRSPQAALELAKQAISASGGDFSKVLAKGDPGSREDVGWIRRGVLERRVEQTVFLLEKGASTKEPIDTPRGYWVVLRSQ